MSVLVQIGNYQLEAEIGLGASSKVWLGRHVALPEHVVAVKLLVSTERELVRRFQREAVIAARLHHPNIPQLFDYGYAEPWHYTVLEYIDGSSLRQVLERRGRLPLSEALDIFAQVAAALDYAHQLELIHRDVSAANILLEADSGRALLTDFGIARDTSQPMTLVHMVMGTPGYLSPEQAQSATSVTQRSDIFSLGIVLYQMLSGELPWPDTASLPLAPEHFAPPLSLKARGVEGLPVAVERVLAKLLALDPAQRYASATAAADELRQALQRHASPTQVLAEANPARARPLALQVSGLEPDELETLLGPDLAPTVLELAHRRAAELGDPAVVAALLDRWAAQDRLRRRPLLGRLARLHKVRSRNVYFYQLRVLYEHRAAPEVLEAPDRKAEVFPLEPELERWAVPLPPPEHFADEPGGQVSLPGSTRVVACSDCSGKGVIICARCQGQQRITVASAGPEQPVQGRGRSAEQTLVPCPDCAGRGGHACQRCQSSGRLVERKHFRWSRRLHMFAAQDDLPALNERWLARVCQAKPIYSQRQQGGMRPEWTHLAPVAALLAAAEARCDPETRIAMSELAISLIPLTDIVFDLGKTGDRDLYKLSIYGFERLIPPDWRFFNWERVISLCVIAFLSLIVIVLLGFALLP